MKLTSRVRRHLPQRDFAGPRRSYPVDTKGRAHAALARASHAVKTGRLSKSAYRKVVRRARAKLGRR